MAGLTTTTTYQYDDPTRRNVAVITPRVNDFLALRRRVVPVKSTGKCANSRCTSFDTRSRRSPPYGVSSTHAVPSFSSTVSTVFVWTMCVINIIIYILFASILFMALIFYLHLISLCIKFAITRRPVLWLICNFIGKFIRFNSNHYYT